MAVAVVGFLGIDILVPVYPGDLGNRSARKIVDPDVERDGVAGRIERIDLFDFDRFIGFGEDQLPLFSRLRQIHFFGARFENRIRGDIGAGIGKSDGERVGHALTDVDQFN